MRPTGPDHDQNAAAAPQWVVVGGILAFLALLGVWIALEGLVDEEDLIAGATSAAVAVAVGFLVSQQGRVLPGLRRTDLARIARLPKQLVVESAQVFAVAARKAVSGEMPPSTWVEVPVELDASGSRAARRGSVITVLMSVTPNDIVGDLDLDTGVAIVHRLVAKRSDTERPDTSPPGAARPGSDHARGTDRDAR